MPTEYKVKHRPPSIERLTRYEHIPPRMTGDPSPPGEDWVSWSEREHAVYEAMMALKREAGRA